LSAVEEKKSCGNDEKRSNFSQFLVGAFDCHSYVYPKYTKIDPYMKASEVTGAARRTIEYDRLAEVYSTLGDLDFGMTEAWNAQAAAKPHYVGCEPMQKRRHSLHCDIPLSQQSQQLG
jgi:hypothetical protein